MSGGERVAKPKKPDPVRDETTEELGELPDFRCRAMFGGHGLYSGETFFGVLFGRRVFFKVSDRTRPKYEEAGSGPFHPNGHSAMRSYYEVPLEVRSDPDEFLAWAREAIAEFRGKRR
jgi:DNA transformation protein and related proteins